MSAARVRLLGHPVGHSLSPVMQNAAFEAAGLAVRYEPCDVAPQDLPAAVAALRAEGVWGANVTVPHKEAMLGLVDDLEPDARTLGAVNTVVRAGAELRGANTDAVGFAASLREAGVQVTGRRVLLLGAGGAGRAVAWALLRQDVRELRVWNRTRARAEALVAALDDPRAGVAEAARVGDAALVVNTTSVGMARGGRDPDASPLEGAWPARAGVAVDAVYRPRATRFLRDAAAAGWRPVDGLGMLLHQGAASFEAWTGRGAPRAAMRAALEAGLAAEGNPA